MVEAAARAGYSHVGLRLVAATPEEQHFPLVADAELRRQTQARLRDTGIKVLDLEILRLKPETCVADFEAILAVGAELGVPNCWLPATTRTRPALLSALPSCATWRRVTVSIRTWSSCPGPTFATCARPCVW